MKLCRYFSWLLLLSLSICSFCQEKYFYIYEWPSELDDVWPPQGAVLHNRSGYSHEFYDNFGAGKLLNSDLGLFQTWQFSLYKNVMARLRVSKYRTRDPWKASAFIIPFDLGVHSYIDHRNGFPRLASPHGWAAGQYLREASRNKTLWWKNNGHDHFVLFSITAFQMVGIGVKVFFMQICQNCTAITIETSPTKTAIKGRSRKYWYAAPYPSSFHWHEDIKKLPWKIEDSPPRNLFILIIGSLKTAQPNSNNLRRLLHSQCEADKSCLWHRTAHSCNGVVDSSQTMLLFRTAVFCPAPTGDSVTRKSVFDSLVAGCIPVLFSRASLSQYMWFVSEKEVDDVSVYIPMKSINNQEVNFVDILKKISPEEIARKQKLIEQIAPRLQYAVVPKRIGNGSLGLTWEPPFPDASSIIIDKILDRKTVEPIEGFTDEELANQHDLQNYLMDTHEDYAALRAIGKYDGNSSTTTNPAISSALTNRENIRRKKSLKGKVAISKIMRTDDNIAPPPPRARKASKAAVSRATSIVDSNQDISTSHGNLMEIPVGSSSHSIPSASTTGDSGATVATTTASSREGVRDISAYASQFI